MSRQLSATGVAVGEAMEENDRKRILAEGDAALGETRRDPFEGLADPEAFHVNRPGRAS